MTERKLNFVIAMMMLAMGLLLMLLAPSARAQDGDSFVPLGLRSSCEWHYGEPCVSAATRLRRAGRRAYTIYAPRGRLPERESRGAIDMNVLALQVELKGRGCLIEADGIMGHETRNCMTRLGPGRSYVARTPIIAPPAGSYIDRVPDRLPPERDRASEEDWESLGRDGCLARLVKAQSDPKIFKDAKTEAVKRWQGAVAAKKGEVWLDWRNAKKLKGDQAGIVCWRSATGERTSDKGEGTHQRCEARGRPCRGDRPGDADKVSEDVGEDREDIEDGARVYIVPPPVLTR